jgi:hypothetical protein
MSIKPRPSAATIGITKDLMQKLADDVNAALYRTLAIAPQPHLPIAMCGGAPLVAMMGALLDTDPGPTPDPDCLLLAGLLLARAGIRGHDAIDQAYKDFEALKAAGRTSEVLAKERPGGS